MRTSYLSAVLAVSLGVSALPQGVPSTPLAPAIPLERFNTKKFTTPLTLEDILAGLFKIGRPHTPPASEAKSLGTDLLADSKLKSAEAENDQIEKFTIAAVNAGTCSNPRVRQEWDSYSNSDRQAYIDAIKCLHNKPAGGQFRQAKNRYEDLVALHQVLTPRVHGNAKFLLWHRYYLWTFEDILRTECGFNRNLPWFDETKYAGRFAQSSIFSSQWFGGIALGGRCVTDGQFANLALNVGPGNDNYLHCLARNGDGSKTQYTSSAIVNGCNAQADYQDMASCSEGGAHAWGHNGIGAVMQDVYGSPGDPVFFLHHAFIDRNLRIWQNADSSRVNKIDGADIDGNPLTLDTNINVYGLRPDVKIRDVLNTLSTTLCYKYNY